MHRGTNRLQLMKIHFTWFIDMMTEIIDKYPTYSPRTSKSVTASPVFVYIASKLCFSDVARVTARADTLCFASNIMSANVWVKWAIPSFTWHQICCSNKYRLNSKCTVVTTMNWITAIVHVLKAKFHTSQINVWKKKRIYHISINVECT